MTIFESTDRDGDTFRVEQEPYTDHEAVAVSVNGCYAYLSAEEVDRLRVALAPYGTGPTPRDTEDASIDLAAFAQPSRAVVKRAQAAMLAVSMLGPDADAVALVSLASFIATSA